MQVNKFTQNVMLQKPHKGNTTYNPSIVKWKYMCMYENTNILNFLMPGKSIYFE